MKRLFAVFALLFLCNCSSSKPDYSLFLRHRPSTILVLPPLNNTATVDAPDKFLSTITYPLAERGYYVIPIAVADRLLKENGVITAIEARQVARDKLISIFGADAILDITIEEWGTSYFVITSSTTVKLKYRLVDLHTGHELWSYEKAVSDSNRDNSGGLVGILVGNLAHAIINTNNDKEVELSAKINNAILPHNGVGLLPGHRFPSPAN